MDTPRVGEIIAYSVADQVGRIRLLDGTELRFGLSSMPLVVPVVGTRVTVLACASHPLGGLKATSVRLAEMDPSTYEDKARAFRNEAAAIIARESAPLEAMRLARIHREAEVRAQGERDRAEGVQRLREQMMHLKRVESSVKVWETLLTQEGLGERDLASLLSDARPAARLIPRSASGETLVGSSKLGGAPDLPAGFIWPRFEGRHLDFLAQIALADVPAPVRTSLYLPAAGLLSFFYDRVRQPWGDNPEERSAAAVRLSPTTSPLTRSHRPDGELTPLPELTLEITEELRLPERPPARVVAALEVGDAHPGARLARFTDPWEAMLIAFDAAGDSASHLLGGHPMPLQDDLPAAGRLLLQLDSDDRLAEMWGDAGRLFFWIREDDLRTQSFESAWFSLQSD